MKYKVRELVLERYASDEDAYIYLLINKLSKGYWIAEILGDRISLHEGDFRKMPEGFFDN